MNNDSINHYNDNEIELKQLVMTLIKRRRFIVGVTGGLTLLVIGYLLLFASPLQYKVEVSFLKPSINSVTRLNQLTGGENSIAQVQNAVFTSFLTTLNSKVLQKQVFIDGGYREKLGREGIEIGDVDKYIEGFTNSISITKAEEKIPGVKLPHILSSQSSNPDVVSEFLDKVLSTADSKTITTIINLERLKIATRLTELTLKRSELLNEARQSRLNNIATLTDSAALAKSLNIIESNLNQFNKDSNNMNLNIAIQSGINIPDWYLYGETALLKMVLALESRASDNAFIPALIPINYEISKLESLSLDSTGINATQLYQAATNQILPTNNRSIVMLAFIGSFILSLVLVLLMDAFKDEDFTSIQKGK